MADAKRPSNTQRVAYIKSSGTGSEMDVQLLPDGPRVADESLRLLWRLEDDGITIGLHANGNDLALDPADRITLLPYLPRLRARKRELLLLVRYVLRRVPQDPSGVSG